MRHLRTLRPLFWLGVRGTGMALLLVGSLLTGGLALSWMQASGEEGGPRPVGAGEDLSIVAIEQLSVLPSWVVSPWGYVAFVLLVLAVVIVFVYWRTAALERRREELERQVAERTQEIQRQKHRITVYNRELLRTNDQLRRTIEEKSTLLGMAAHDLKNPLFGIRALSEILLEDEALEPKVRRKVDLIRSSADESMHLIDDLLASVAESAQAQSEVTPVDLGTLTRWVVHSFAPHAERKDQVLHCAVEDNGCVVEGDKRRLREAISNLVSNALKYSPSGEAVEVSVAREDGTVTVAVTDAGPGLSEGDQKRMFAPFQRLTPTPTGEESSSGLGLYIVKQVVDRHEGQIEVESALGEGSTFRLGFPASENDPEPMPESDPPEVEHVR